ncbi:MAG TPA: hypothetical protein VEC37_01035, partial [Bacillota bacterium]|nr:hypothetical protein [Bacillota bacterium]
SPAENYRSDSIHYNINQMTGTMGALKGVVKGSQKDFHLTGESARMEAGTTVIQNAELTRSTLQNHPDYSFAARRLVISGNNIHMEKVFFKFFGGKTVYLPRLVLQGEAVPRIDLSANQGEEIDLSQVVAENTKAAETISHSKRVEVNPRFQVAVNPFDKPSMITVGRIYTLNRYTEEVDLNFDTRGIFSFSNIFQIDWPKYNFTIDGRTDLVEHPQQEFGIAITKKAWKTDFGNWQVGLLSRWLGYEDEGETYQGIYGGYRLDYQLNQDLNLSYLYLNELNGTEQDWEHLEEDFLTINNYKLGGNLTYSLTVPLSPHYVIYSRGYYSLQYDSWTSQKVLFSREVGSIKMGCGWDFAKNFVELQFKMNI